VRATRGAAAAWGEAIAHGRSRRGRDVFTEGGIVRRLVAWTVFDQVTGNTIRQLVYLPLMPPVPSGTFVRKREVFQGVLGPISQCYLATPGSFFRKYGVGP
jgi:hypothetical protein